MDGQKLGLPLMDEIAYVCDGMACDECGIFGERECYHTTDIRHAKNFTEIEPGKFMENYAIPPLKIAWKEK